MIQSLRKGTYFDVSVLRNRYKGKPETVRKWGSTRLVTFLDNMGFDKVVDAFVENEVDGTTFLELTYDDLKEDLGIADEDLIASLLSVVAQIHTG